MRAIRKAAAWILGSVLFIAGILKLMDPVGTGLIVSEYYRFFGVTFLDFTAKTAGVALALFETVLGSAVITGVWRRTVSLVSLVVLCGFTLLTLALLIVNPSMDCGCFGEMIHLTHFQSFIKNIVLLVFWVLAYVPTRSLLPVPGIKYAGFGISALSAVLFCLYSLSRIPMLDFTPMAPGVELLGADGVGSGDDAPVLSFYDRDGEYRDELVQHGDVIVLSIYDMDGVSQRSASEMGRFSDAAEEVGYTVVRLSGGTPAAYDAVAERTGLPADAFFADRKTLLTLNRSNGGATFISDGQIVCKWPARHLPDGEKLVSVRNTGSTEAVIAENSPQRTKLQAFLLYEFAVMLLL